MTSAEKRQISTRVSPVWMGFVTRKITGRGTIKIRIRWGKMALFVLFLAIFAWIGKSVAFFYFFRNIRHFEEVTYVDMLAFPLNRTTVRIQQGNYQIVEGQKALEREDYRRALGLLRNGLARSPSNMEGRLLLAQLYSSWRPELATEIMVEGIDDGKRDAEYVKIMFALLLLKKADSRVLEISGKLLEEPLPEKVLLICRIARLQSAMLRGRYGVIQQVFDESGVKNTADGVLIGAQLYRHIGKDDEARQLLKAVLASKPKGDLREIYIDLIRILLDNGLGDEARETALAYVIENPVDWRPRIMLIEVLHENGRFDRRDQEIESFMLQNRNTEEAMKQLAYLCARQGNVSTTKRIYEIALEKDFNLGTFTLILIEADIRNGQYQTAIGLCNELASENPEWLVSEKDTFNAIRSIAYLLAGNSEIGSIYLKDFLDSRRASESTLFQAAVIMSENDLLAEALLVLRKAYEANPQNESVLAMLIETEMKLGAYYSIGEHFRELFELRQPKYSRLSNFHESLQSDRFLFVENRAELLKKLEEMISEMETMNWDIWNLKRMKAV